MINESTTSHSTFVIVLGSLKLLSKLFREKFAEAQLSNVAGVFFLGRFVLARSASFGQWQSMDRENKSYWVVLLTLLLNSPSICFFCFLLVVSLTGESPIAWELLLQPIMPKLLQTHLVKCQFAWQANTDLSQLFECLLVSVINI